MGAATRVGTERSVALEGEEAQILYPVLAQALATAHIEDLYRAAARRRAIRFARRVVHEPHVAHGMTPTEIPQAAGIRSSMT